MDKQLRVSLKVINSIEQEQRPRESYSECIQRLLEELTQYRSRLQHHRGDPSISTVSTGEGHA